MENETEIIQSVLAGDREKFGQLVSAHQDKVFALCLSFLYSPGEAEDAAQEVFIKAYRNLKKFRFEAEFATWLYRIAYRKCLDLIKAKKALKECVLTDDAAVEAHAVVSPEERELIEKALAGLPEDYRALLVMREGNNLSYEEIASILGVSTDAVDARLRRARNAFTEIARRFLEQPASK